MAILKKKTNNLKLEKSLKLLAKSSIFVFVGIFLSKVFTYIYRIIIARHFGAESYGLFSLAVIVLGLFVTVASLGFLGSLVRFIPQYREKGEFGKIRYLIRLTSLSLLVSSIIFGIILFFSSELISLKIFNDARLIFPLKLFSFLVPLWILSIYYRKEEQHK